MSEPHTNPKPAPAAAPPVKKFDPKQAHGVVYGHLSGKFEQGGVLYGADGLPVPAKKIASDEVKLRKQQRAELRRRERELEELDEADDE